MGELLESLHKLQELELKLAAIRRDRESRIRFLNACRRKVQKIEERLDAHNRQLRDRQIQLDTLSLDVTAREDSIAKHREALTKAKTNREYAAVLTAMNTEKADVMKIETDVLQRMEDIQKFKDEHAALEAEREKLQADVARAEQAVEAFDEQSETERTALEAEREAHADHVEPTAMAAFRRVALKLDGEAMATITRVHPKKDDYVCGGCNMNVSLEVVSSLQSRDDIQLCQVCGRILYLPNRSPQRAGT